MDRRCIEVGVTQSSGVGIPATYCIRDFGCIFMSTTKAHSIPIPSNCNCIGDVENAVLPGDLAAHRPVHRSSRARAGPGLAGYFPALGSLYRPSQRTAHPETAVGCVSL
jgi:hypothetical protein